MSDLVGTEIPMFANAAETEAAIKAAHDAAEERWRVAALEAFRVAALRYSTFDTDIIDAILDTQKIYTKEPRAMGGIVRRAIAEGYIEHTGRFVRSVLVKCHNRPKAIYRSKLFEGDAA